eukprot:gene25285-biopygen9018
MSIRIPGQPQVGLHQRPEGGLQAEVRGEEGAARRLTSGVLASKLYGQLPVKFTPFTGNLQAITGNLLAITGNYWQSTGNCRQSRSNLWAITGNLRAITGNLRAIYRQSTGNDSLRSDDSLRSELVNRTPLASFPTFHCGLTIREPPGILGLQAPLGWYLAVPKRLSESRGIASWQK